MTFKATTYAAACALAVRLRRLYAGFTVQIVRPLFAGDTYRVNVG
jgi:hypothetical protein